MRRVPPFASFVQEQPGPIPCLSVGPYEAYRFLGRGGNGVALAARHVESGQIATVKLMAGTEGPVADWLGDDLPDAFLRIYAHGITDEVYGPQPWAAREPAAETFRDLMVRRDGVPLPLPEILSIFRLACDAVGQLHAHRTFRWSAHFANVFCVEGGWKLGDLGRCVMTTTANDPRFLAFFGLTESRPVERAAFLAGLNAGPWNAANGSGICAHDPYRERRLQLDDCAALAGLLVDLLGANRWQLFDRALSTVPLCFGRYNLTGDRRRDATLSRILNRAWLGDAGGALARVDGHPPGLAPSDDPRDLCDDVCSAFRA